MVDIDAENNRLRIPVRFLKELGYLLGHDLRSLLDNELAVEILFLVNTVANQLSVVIDGSSVRTPTIDVDVRFHANNLVWGKEAVLDSLLQRVRVRRFPKVIDVRHILRFLRGGRHADLHSGAKVLEYLAPGRIVGRAAAMAFVDDDEIPTSCW